MKLLTLPVVIIAALNASSADARTWHVFNDGSGDAPTIQAGIDSAAVGDTVLVGPGTYLEHPDFLGKDIVLKSSMGPEATILDGSLQNELWVVIFINGESRSAIIEGLTITGGAVGIAIRNAEPTVQENIVKGNHGGGGIACDRSDNVNWKPLFKGNVIRDNSADAIGGGITVTGGVTPEIVSNEILNNTAFLGDGGGIYLRSSAPGAVISGNLIIGNHADDMGGGVFISYPPADGTSGFEISWNVISGNSSNSVAAAGNRSGGGMLLFGSGAWVHHNTIVENTDNEFSQLGGGGITLLNEVNPLVEQNIIALTTAGTGIVCLEASTATFRNNLIWENEPVDLGAECESQWGDSGNITADPGFCGQEFGDFSLNGQSPAFTHPAGPLGAISVAGCGSVPVHPTTWGRIKAKYGN